MSLTQCPGCARHVRLGPSECPFCSEGLPTQRTITRHLSRGAGVLISAAAIAACVPMVATPVYGAPAPPSASPSVSPSPQP